MPQNTLKAYIKSVNLVQMAVSEPEILFNLQYNISGSLGSCHNADLK